MGKLVNVLEILLPKERKLSQQEEREHLVNSFLQTHPYASWEWLGGSLLHRQQNASRLVKSHIKPNEGMYVGMSTLCTMVFGKWWSCLRRWSFIV